MDTEWRCYITIKEEKVERWLMTGKPKFFFIVWSADRQHYNSILNKGQQSTCANVGADTKSRNSYMHILKPHHKFKNILRVICFVIVTKHMTLKIFYSHDGVPVSLRLERKLSKGSGGSTQHQKPYGWCL